MNQNDLFLCQHCCDCASSVSEIVIHHKDYHELQALPYFECENCNYYSEKLLETKEHIKNQHGLDTYKPYKCKQCDYITENFTKFSKSHLPSHFVRESKYVCEVCDQILKTPGSLRVHKSLKHDNKKCVCDICGHVSKSSLMLQKHIKYVHER